MPTHCAIIARVNDEEYHGIYVHHGGHLGGVGVGLHQSYRDHEKVLRLMARGDRSSLDESPDDHAYVDDGEGLNITKGATASAVTKAIGEKYVKAIGEKYVYVWDGEEWRVGLGDRLLSTALRGLEARRRWTAMKDSEANDYLAGLEDSKEELGRKVALLRRALGELLDPPGGTDIRDRIRMGRFAMEQTREGD